MVKATINDIDHKEFGLVKNLKTTWFQVEWQEGIFWPTAFATRSVRFAASFNSTYMWQVLGKKSIFNTHADEQCMTLRPNF